MIGSEIHKQFSWLFARTSPEDAKMARDKLAKRFTDLDKHFASNSCLMGDRFTDADAHLFVVTNWSNFMDIDLKVYANLSGFMARVAVRPKVVEALKAVGLIKG